MKLFQLLPAVYREELMSFTPDNDEDGMGGEFFIDYESLTFRNLYIDFSMVESFISHDDKLTEVTMQSGVQYLVQCDERTFRTLCEDYAQIRIQDFN